MADAEKLKDEVLADSNQRSILQGIIGHYRSISPADLERSLAKTTKLLNRVKKFYSEPNLRSLISDLMKLDLTMYMEELVSALTEAFRTMKLKDSFSFIEICFHVGLLYPMFGDHIFSSLKRVFESVMNDNLRLRIYLRVISELMLTGVVPAELVEDDLLSIFSTVLCFQADSVSPQTATIRLNALTYWIGRYSAILLDDRLPAIIQTFYDNTGPLLLDNAKSAITHQEALHAQLRIDKGHVDAENEAKLSGLVADLDKFNQLLSTIQTVLNLPSPRISHEAAAPAEKSPVTEMAAVLAEEIVQFADESEKSFYTDLLDLSVRLPSAFLEEKTSSEPIKPFLEDLKSCSSPSKADELALRWFETGLNSKSNKKQLLDFLIRADFSPVHLRLVANLHAQMRDLSESFTTELKKKALKNMDQRAIQTLGELIKFAVCPLGTGVEIIQTFVNDLNAKSAEAAAWLLVSCGRFLVNDPDVGSIVDTLLVRLVKLTRGSQLPTKVQMSVEDAFYQSKPKKVESVEQKFSPLQRYIRYLVQVEIYRVDEDEILRLVRSLPWSSERAVVESTIREAILDLNTNFVKVYCVASLLAGLVKYEEPFVINIIDAIFELFQVGIEKEDFRQAPYRVRLARLIGELYAFKLIDSNVVLDICYQLIGFRSASSFGASEHTVLFHLLTELDGGDDLLCQLQQVGFVDEPSWSYIRINLIATLVRTMGEFFAKGPNKKRMLRFLVMFRRYLFIKSSGSSLPVRIVNVVNDMFDSLDVRKFDIRTDSLELVSSDLGVIRKELEAVTAGLVPVCLHSDSEDVNLQNQDLEEDVSVSDDEESSDVEYARESEEGDAEMNEFDKELQAMMVDGLAEARSGRKISPQLPSFKDQDEEQATGSAFKIMSRGPQGGKAQTVGIVVVPENHKLRQSQEMFRLELEEKDREKKQLKQFIMAYERASNEPGPQSGHSVTLGQADRKTQRRVFNKF